MALTTMRRELSNLRALATCQTAPAPPILAELRSDPALVLSLAEMVPDAWQTTCIRSPWLRELWLCGRQCGKSQTAAALALVTALLQDGSLTLLLSPTLRQSGELFRDKLLRMWRRLDCPLMDRRPTQLSLELTNGSRVVSLPENEEGIRGFSGVNLLIIDEAARVGDTVYRAVRPFLATSRGKLVALSTPFGRRGWFSDEWHGEGSWRRVRVPATECPRIDPAFLRDEERALGRRWFAQEYLCEFADAVGAVFADDDIAAAMSNDVEPLYPTR